jgi:hypothetical protein
MSIARSGLRNSPRLFNNGSIKEGYLHQDDEIEELESKLNVPGPGQY